jgi:hypothetical protein
VRAEYDPQVHASVRQHFARSHSIAFENYPLGPLTDPPVRAS